MAYLINSTNRQSISREAAYSAIYHPEKLDDDPLYEKIYERQKLGDDFFPMWHDAHKALIRRISHAKGIPSGYLAQLESAPTPKDLRRLYGPGVYEVQIRGPIKNDNGKGIKRRFSRLATFLVVVPIKEEKKNKKTPLPASVGLSGDIDSTNDVVIFNNFGKKPQSLSSENIFFNADTKSSLNGLKTQDIEAPPPAAEKQIAKTKDPLKPPPDQYDFIRALSQRSDSESESED